MLKGVKSFLFQGIICSKVASNIEAIKFVVIFTAYHGILEALQVKKKRF